MTRRWLALCVVVIALIVAATFMPATRLNFYADDYSFVEIAGRSTLPDYLAFYFDPRAQTGWYRPLQGMLFGGEWLLFGANPVGYHVVNVIVHAANCLLLFALVWRVARRALPALSAALVYAGMPLHNVAVFWPGDADFLLTFFYLLAIFFWLGFIQPAVSLASSRFTSRAARVTLYVLSFIFFLCALLTKEFGVTLPVSLFLADVLLVREKIRFAVRVRRYAPFALVWLVYLPLELSIQSRSVLTNVYGYGFGAHTLPNFFQYLAWLAFPWGLPEPANYVWLGAATGIVAGVIVVKRNGTLLFLALMATLAFLPVINFPWFFTRYLYFAVMATAIVLAGLVAWARKFIAPKWFALAWASGIALIVAGNAFGVAQAAAEFAEIGRQTRVPFRDISQRHPSLPADTHLYFIDPPTITSQLSGMFFLRYGAGISVASNEAAQWRARWREHANAYVIYFDEQKRTREILVDQQAAIEMQPRTPLDFGAGLRLVALAMPSTRAKRGDAFAVFLEWQATGAIEKNYAVTLRLLDATGRTITQVDAEPRGGMPPMTVWRPGETITDARVVFVPTDAPPGVCRLVIALVGVDEPTATIAPLRIE